MRHLDPIEMRVYVAGLPPHERSFLAHLLACPHCHGMMTQALDAGEAPLESPADGLYEQAFTSALERLRLRSDQEQEEREQARRLLEELERQPRERWGSLVKDGERYLSVPFVALLLDQVARTIAADPLTAEAQAELAGQLAEDLAAAAPVSVRVDLLARSWSWIGHISALRHSWAEADAAFEKASRLLAEETGYQAEALYCRLLAESFEARQRLPEALALLDRSAAISGSLGEVDHEIDTLKRQARLYLQLGDVERAGGVIAGALVRAEAAGVARPDLRELLVTVLAGLDLEQLPSDRELSEDLVEDLLFRDLARALVSPADTLTVEAQLRAVLAIALRGDQGLIGACAALRLASIYTRQARGEALRNLAPAINALAGSPELSAKLRQVFERFYMALRDQTGAVELLALAAVAVLEGVAGNEDLDEEEETCIDLD